MSARGKPWASMRFPVRPGAPSACDLVFIHKKCQSIDVRKYRGRTHRRGKIILTVNEE